MANSQPPNRQLISGRAARLAFKIGQAVEQILVDRAMEIASRESTCQGETLVTTEHIREALAGSVFREALADIGGSLDGEPKPPRSTEIAA